MNSQQQAAELQAYLYALYHAPSTSAREQANEWLNRWQLSGAAWGLAHDILLGRVRVSPHCIDLMNLPCCALAHV